MNKNEFEPIIRVVSEYINPDQFPWIANMQTAYTLLSKSNPDITYILIGAKIGITSTDEDGKTFSIVSTVMEIVYDERDEQLALKLADGTLLFSSDGVTYTEENDEYSYDDIDVEDIKIFLAN